MAVEQDDDVMTAYLEGEEPDTATLKRPAAARDTVSGKLVPGPVRLRVQDKGVQRLLDAVVRLPAEPARCPGDRGHKARHRGCRSASRGTATAAALRLQGHEATVVGPAHLRPAYAGRVESGSYWSTTVKDQRERIGRIL
jgi:elongation factor G